MAINPIICLDFETGGLDCKKHATTQIAYQAFELDTYKPLLEFSTYIQPYANLEYQEAAMKYTGITFTQLANGMDIKEVVKKLCEDLKEITSSHTKKPVIMGHNIGFDIGFLMFAFNFCKIDITKFFNCNDDIPASIDTLLLAKQKWANNPKVTSFNLSSCCNTAGVEITDAHHAMNDVKATKELFFYFTNGLRSGDNQATEDTVKHTRVRNNFKFQF